MPLRGRSRRQGDFPQNMNTFHARPSVPRSYDRNTQEVAGQRIRSGDRPDHHPSQTISPSAHQRHDPSMNTRRVITSVHSRNMSPGERTFYTLFSGPAEQAPPEEEEEIYLWRKDFDFFADANSVMHHAGDVDDAKAENPDDFMTLVANCLGLGRGYQLVTEPGHEIIEKERKNRKRCRVPTSSRTLSTTTPDNIPFGIQKNPQEPPVSDYAGRAHILHPVLDSSKRSLDIPSSTSTLAQKMVKHPSSRWFNDCRPQLRLDVPVCRKMLIWARMMLVNHEDRSMLQKSDIYRGVLASLYCFQADPSLVAAFLTYWNVDGHTLVTSQGEMGYPLHTISDAMGIPISGRLYEEFIPPCSDVHGHLETLYAIYASLCPSELQPGPGLVSLTAWLDHFFDDKADSFGSSLLDGFADPKDPLLQKLRFHVAVQGDRPAAILGAETLSYRSMYPSTVYRAAFITAWLCTYCIPVEAGQYIRPEVFHMAVQISEGVRRAIGVASLAFLYNCLDNIHDN